MSVVPFPPMKRPLVAILRGVRPEEAKDVVSVLIDSGMTAIEIPLNSPDPFRSIEIAVRRAPAEILVGAGTVLTLDDVARLHAVGGVSDTNFADYTKAGIVAFGLGSSLYKPGMTAAQVAVRAKATIEAYDRAIEQR